MNEPNNLLALFDEEIDKVARTLVKSRALSQHHFDDAIQEVRIKLLEKADNLTSAYRGEAQFSTYINSVILNAFKQYLRQNYKRQTESLKDDQQFTSPNDSMNGLLIHEEKELLKQAVKHLMRHKMHRFLLAIKCYFKIPITSVDIKKYCTDHPEEEAQFLLAINEYTKKEEIYFWLNRLFNTCEGKNNTPDSVRIWINEHLNKLIKYLNKTDKSTHHDKNSISLLFDLVQW